MIVVDASAMLELLLQTALGRRVEARLFGAAEEMHAPHLLDVEIVQALRRIAARNDVAAGRAQEALGDLAQFDVVRHAHRDLLARAWQLRQNLSGYDATYVALAEALDATLVTCDGPLGRAPGHTARVEVIA